MMEGLRGGGRGMNHYDLVGRPKKVHGASKGVRSAAKNKNCDLLHGCCLG